LKTVNTPSGFTFLFRENRDIFLEALQRAQNQVHIVSVPAESMIKRPFNRLSDIISLRVSNPEKSANGEYVVFRITTMTEQHPQGIIVSHRYTEFVSFHDQLLAAEPQVKWPQLPERSYAAKFDSEFIHQRCIALDR
jgi:hypothetical protein